MRSGRCAREHLAGAGRVPLHSQWLSRPAGRVGSAVRRRLPLPGSTYHPRRPHLPGPPRSPGPSPRRLPQQVSHQRRVTERSQPKPPNHVYRVRMRSPRFESSRKQRGTTVSQARMEMRAGSCRLRRKRLACQGVCLARWSRASRNWPPTSSSAASASDRSYPCSSRMASLTLPCDRSRASRTSA